MLTFLKRPLYVLSNKIHRRHRPGEPPEEKWIADLSKLENFPFDIKPESSYDAYPAGNLDRPQQSQSAGRTVAAAAENNSLGFALKKANHIAWIEAPGRRYQDQIIEARFLLDSLGGYAAAGLVFRLIDNETYYLALVSSKGYFRLDAVKNDSPLPLVGWTETPVFDEQASKDGPREQDRAPLAIDLTIVACGEDLTFLVNGRWIGEICDSPIVTGRVGFALASYTAPSEQTAYTCRAWLDYLSVDSRRKYVEECREKWKTGAAVSAESRIRLAETFAAMGAADLALAQISRVWKQREAAARSVSATYTEMRTRRELFLAAGLARRLERYDEAEEYINACLEQGPDTPEGKKALTEKTTNLLMLKKYPELKAFAREQITRRKKDPSLHDLLGHAHWNLKEYADAARAWDKAFKLDGKNGQYAVNAANAYMLLDKQDEALARCLAGGAIFLRQDDTEALGALIPKLLSLGGHNWEARALAGKWAFGAGDFDQAESELVTAEGIRRKLKPQPPVDPAVSYLRGLLFVRRGKRREALRFLEEAAGLAPDYGLFRFKLAETRYLFSRSVRTPGLAADLKAALSLMPNDGWVRNFAAQICLARNSPGTGRLAAAEQHLQKAAAALGEIPAVKVNRGTLCYLRGSLDEALKILDAGREDDPEGLMAHCAGKLLFRSGDIEKAGVFYRKALDIAPDNGEYLAAYVTCLMELKRFAQAKELLAGAQNKNPSPEIQRLIKGLNAKKKMTRGRHPAAARPVGPKRKPGRPRKNPPVV
jgi:tetratricopeptide (TPR) repeat protein